jgi:hypothetical protein
MLRIAITKAVPVTKNHCLGGGMWFCIKRLNNQFTGSYDDDAKKA